MRHGGWRAGYAVGLAVVTIGLTGWSPARADGATTVTGGPSATVVRVGARVLVTGTVTSDGRRAVHLQRKAGRTWSTVASTTSTGSYSLRLPTADPGVAFYRVVTPASARRAAGESSLFTVGIGSGSAASRAFLTSPPVRWDPCTTIGYRVNLTDAPPGALKDVRQAVEQVALATGLRFRYHGATDVIPGRTSTSELETYPRDTTLVIAYARPASSQYLRRAEGALGVGGVFYQLKSEKVNRTSWHRAVQGYVVMDQEHGLPAGFGTGRATGKLGTSGQVLMHELGHVVGLDHPDVVDETQIMHTATTEKPARWGLGDLVGLHVLGRNSGCFSAKSSAATNSSAAMLASTRR